MPKRSAWKPVLTCCQCGGKKEVKLYSPDMDIDPVPLYVVCWFEILGAARRRDTPGHDDGEACGE